MSPSQPSSMVVSRRGRVALVVGCAAALALGLTPPGPADARAAASTAPSLPSTTFTSSEAPTASFLTTASGTLSLTQQTVAGLAGQQFAKTPGLTASQVAASRDGFTSSIAYPASATGTAPTPVATAVGYLTGHHTVPESSAAPGCSLQQPGQVSRVAVVRSGSRYVLSISTSQTTGFTPVKSWKLPTYTTGGPTGVAVLDPTCGFDGPSVIAVTFPGGIDFYAYDGSGRSSGFTPAPDADGVLRPTGSWLPGASDGVLVRASAHRNADASYVAYTSGDGEGASDDTNATMVAATVDTTGAVVLHHLVLTSLDPALGNGIVSDTALPVASVTPGAVTASLAYDNDRIGVRSDARYALAVRSGSTTSVWFGDIGHGSNAGNAPALQTGACAGSTLPALSLVNLGHGDEVPDTGVACTVTRGSSTLVQQWSTYGPTGDDGQPTYTFPTAMHGPVATSLTGLTGATPFATWPCHLLGLRGGTGCSADTAVDVVGTVAGQPARFLQLPTIGGQGKQVTRDIAGSLPGAAVDAVALPLTRAAITVVNTSKKATYDAGVKVPVLYMMPAPEVDGLDQPNSGAPVSFGMSSGTGGDTEASFSTTVGATVSASLGEPAIAAVNLTASVENSVERSHTSSTQVTSTTTFNDNDNEPTVVYVQRPMWTWTGTVTKDSTGIGSTRHAAVRTQIAVADPARHPETLDADTVWNLQADPDFQPTGVYGPTLLSVYGDGVFEDPRFRTTVHSISAADPGAYPSFDAQGSAVPMLAGQPFCDTYSGSVGVSRVNSGVSSPFTSADLPASGASFLTANPPSARVKVGSGLSTDLHVQIDDTSSDTYATQFSASASAGIEIGGVGASLEAGFSLGNSTTVSASSGQEFGADIGNLVGASRAPAEVSSTLAAAINASLASETYAWEPFMCHRTTPLPQGGQTTAMVVGFATSGFTGLSSVPATGTPVGKTGSTTKSAAPTVAPGSALTFTPTGPTAAYQVELTRTSGAADTVILETGAQSPPAAVTTPQAARLTLPAGTASGTYAWRPVTVDWNGERHVGATRYVKLA